METTTTPVSNDVYIYNIIVKTIKRCDGVNESENVCLGQYTSLDKINIRDLAVSLIESDIIPEEVPAECECDTEECECVGYCSTVAGSLRYIYKHEKVCKGIDCNVNPNNYCSRLGIRCLSYYIIKTKLNGCCKFGSYTKISGGYKDFHMMKGEKIIQFSSFKELVKHCENIIKLSSDAWNGEWHHDCDEE